MKKTNETMNQKDNIKIFSGTSNPLLAQDIAHLVGIRLGELSIQKFKDGEIYVRIEECVRGKEVFVIQSLSAPVNENLMELLIILDAFKRASAKNITIVIPYLGYARQDRKTSGREAITAKLVADLLTVAGADRVLSVDMHTSQIQGFFNIPVDHLRALPMFVHYVKNLNLKVQNMVVVSPDMGGITRARKFSQSLKCPIGIIDKHRTAHNEAVANFIIGDVKDKVCLILDDMIDTAGTICEAARILKEHGAGDIYIFATHPVFSQGALEKLSTAPVKECIITDTISLAGIKIPPFVKQVSVAPLLAEAIKTIYCDKSMSALLKKMQTS